MESGVNNPYGRHVLTQEVNSGEKWAFVHRMIEEEDGPKNIMQSELHSIALFCQHTDCPLPKEVSSCLLRESSTARLATMIICAGLVLSIYIILGLFLWLGLMGLGVANNSFLASIAGLTRGMILELQIILVVYTISLATALNGISFNTAAALLATVVVCGGFMSAVWIVTTPNDSYGVRTQLIFLGEGSINFILATVFFTLLVR